jgi:predicted ATPase
VADQGSAGPHKVDRFFVITGGPGSGKSTLVNALRTQGVQTMPEAGRAIIQDQVAIGGNALPWGNRFAFAELMLGWAMRAYREARSLAGSVVFDRGIPDVLGYLNLSRLDAASHIRRAAGMFRYNPRVFIAPHWPEIFSTDTERKQSEEEARATCNAMAAVYTDQGYELVTLPLAPVEDRVQFVLDRIT